MKRVKRDRLEKKERDREGWRGRGQRKTKELDCAGIFEDILPCGKTDIAPDKQRLSTTVGMIRAKPGN